MIGRANLDGSGVNQSFITGPDGVGWRSMNCNFRPQRVQLRQGQEEQAQGTAKLSVIVPGPGELGLAKTKNAKGAEEQVAAAGEAKLPVKPKGEAKKKLNEQGKSNVEAEGTFTPTGGTPNTEGKKIKLVKEG